MRRPYRYPFRTSALAEPHGVPRQINRRVLDVDSYLSGFGEHKRCKAYSDVADPAAIEVICDDAVPGTAHLPWPTVEQAKAVAQFDFGGRLTFVSSESWFDDRGDHHVTYYFRRQPVRRSRGD